MIRRPVTVAAVAVLPLALASSVASAADATVGNSAAPSSLCGGNQTYFQTSTVSGPSYAVPFDGIITSFSITGPVGQPREFKLGRGTGGSVAVIASTAQAAIPASGTLTQNVRISAEAGDVLGEYHGPANNNCSRMGASGDVVTAGAGDTLPGSVANSGTVSYSQIAVSARVESDADKDGFGDTTQDKCPTQADTQGLCNIALSALPKPSGKAKVGKKLTAPAVATPAGATESFLWFRSFKKKGHRTVTKPIGGATGSVYKVKGTDRGKKLFVRVTLSGASYNTATADSGSKRAK